MNQDVYDVIMIGAAPAGLTAAIYTARERLKTLVLEKSQCGGLAATTELIENYPGFPDGISGMELTAKMKAQAEKFGAEIIELEEVKELIPSQDRLISLRSEDKTFQGRSVIIASGSIPKMLNLPGEKELRGRGVTYCATCDGPLFRGKDVAVIGCGNSGLQEGEALLKYVKSVTFVEFLSAMTASVILQERLRQHKNAAFLLNHALIAINGKNVVDSITVKERASGLEKKVAVSGVFIYAGYIANSQFLKGVVKLDTQGYIITDDRMQTSVPGIFAVGDIRAKEVRQITVACAEGTIAALAVREYLTA
ncbi:MAG: FAD-dependent oxidoreductase [Candidatus Omnitrophota bacterium]